MIVDSMKTATFTDSDGGKFRVNTLDCGTLSAYQTWTIMEKMWLGMPSKTDEGYPVIVTPLMFQGDMSETFKIVFPRLK